MAFWAPERNWAVIQLRLKDPSRGGVNGELGAKKHTIVILLVESN